MDEKEFLLYEVIGEDPLELQAHSRVFVKTRTSDELGPAPDNDEILSALANHPIALRPGKYRLFPAGDELDVTVHHTVSPA